MSTVARGLTRTSAPPSLNGYLKFALMLAFQTLEVYTEHATAIRFLVTANIGGRKEGEP